MKISPNLDGFDRRYIKLKNVQDCLLTKGRIDDCQPLFREIYPDPTSVGKRIGILQERKMNMF
jgi:hypothetical protein